MSEVVAFPREPRFERIPFDAIKPSFDRGLVKSLMPLQGVGYIAGPSGAYKTFLALDWALRIAEGASILGHKTTPRAVIYLAAEAPKSVERRVEAWRRENQRLAVPFELIRKAPDLRSAEDVEDLICELHLSAEESRARGRPLGLVVIDTLAASMPGGDENAGADMSVILANIWRIAEEVGCFVLIVSHTGKDEGRGIRGWSGQFAGADMVVMLTRDALETAGEVRVGKVAKVKDGEDGQRFAISLKPVCLGYDEDDEPVFSAVVCYDDAPQTATNGRRRPLNHPAVLTLSALDRLEDAGQLQAVPLVPGVRPGTKGATVKAVREAVFAMGLKRAEDPGEDSGKVERERWLSGRRKAFQRAVEDLDKAGKVRQEGDWLWRV